MRSSERTRGSCPLCGGHELKVIYPEISRNGSTYDLDCCEQCGTCSASPFPARDMLARMYSAGSYREADKRFIAPLEWFVRRFRAARLARIKKFVPKGRMLDIGCGRGLMLSFAKAEGWEISGLEADAGVAAEVGRRLGIEVRSGGLDQAGFDEGSFDVICLWHVLEHLEDPAGTVRKCSRLLRPQGLLVVAVPNFHSLQARLSGRHWFHLDVPYHLYQFSARGLGDLLGRHSFEVLKTYNFSMEQNPYGFLQSLLNVMGIRQNYLYELLKTRRLRPGGKDAGGLASLVATCLLLPVLLPVSLLLSVFEAAVGRGGTIEVYARKVGP